MHAIPYRRSLLPVGLCVVITGALKMTDMKMTDQIAGHENAGHEIAGREGKGKAS